jgi:hypothetical protein
MPFTSAPTIADLAVAAFDRDPAACRLWIADCVARVIHHCPDERLPGCLDAVRRSVSEGGYPRLQLARSLADLIAQAHVPMGAGEHAADAVSWACAPTPRNMAHALHQCVNAAAYASGYTKGVRWIDSAGPAEAEVHRAIYAQRFGETPEPPPAAAQRVAA